MKVGEINTPALLVDLDAMEANLRRMADFFSQRTAKLRPHFKNHKVPVLAWKQLRAGAVGMTCATVREAEILAQHGIDDILIANEVAGEGKAQQLAGLSRHASIIVALDSASAAKDLARAQRNRRTRIAVVVDIDIGLNRCGVQPGQPAMDLARRAVDLDLNFRGIMGYDGHLQALPQSEERDMSVRAGSKSLVDSAALIQSAGIPVPIISTGGTGTYEVAGAYPDITEIQAGSYLLMDTLYLDRGSRFQRTLTVLTTVISRHEAQRAVVDCGVKAISAERGLSQLKNVSGARLTALHAEHGLLEIDASLGAPPAIGQKIEVWVQYSDATVNLHRLLYGVRNGEVEEIFRIEH